MPCYFFMNKFKLCIIFWLGILIGAFGLQLHNKLDEISQPIIHAGKFDLNQLIASITSTINPKKLNLTDTKYERFDKVYDILQNNYYEQDKLNSGAMIEKAVKAFVDAIDDPYTVYMDSAQNSGFQTELKGESDFEGIGAVVTKKDYYVMIEEVLKASPAYNAGLMNLDRIVMIGTWSTKDLDINEAVSRIRWPKGTKVKLTIERIKKDETKEVFEKEVTRDRLLVPSVTSKILNEKTNTPLGYINISIIGEETEKLLKKNLEDLKKSEKTIKGIILDLRGNGGWLLPIAVEIASHFIPEGKLVVTAKYKTYNDEVYTSKGYEGFQWIPMVVLVDWMTASAGEIIAIALKEQIWAKIIGTQSFGKGSIQTMDQFTDNASLKYTIGKRYTPADKNVDKIWITPDVKSEFDTDGFIKDRTDNQLETAKEELTKMIQ